MRITKPFKWKYRQLPDSDQTDNSDGPILITIVFNSPRHKFSEDSLWKDHKGITNPSVIALVYIPLFQVYWLSVQRIFAISHPTTHFILNLLYLRTSILREWKWCKLSRDLTSWAELCVLCWPNYVYHIVYNLISQGKTFIKK